MEMLIYSLLRDVNNSLFTGKTFSDQEKKEITGEFLSSVSGGNAVKRYHAGVKAPDDGRILYPLFFIPPYNNGKKLRLVTGELPKTQILSANHYELEIMRILAHWGGDNPAVRDMLAKTLERLRTTCFARFCPTGECVGAGVSTLRLLSAVKTFEDEWISRLLEPLISLYLSCGSGMAALKKNMPVFYLYAAITEIGNEQCRELVKAKKEWIIHMLGRGGLTGPAEADTYNTARLYVLRNALALLPGFEYMRKRPVYISEKDGRCYCDV